LCCSVVNCVVLLLIVLVSLFVLFYVLFVCKCVLPPGDNPVAVNKYVIYIIYQFQNIKFRPFVGANCHDPFETSVGMYVSANTSQNVLNLEC